MNRKERLKIIIRAIENENIRTQEELTSKLLSLGVSTSQATISRDIKELNLIKIDDGVGGYKYARPIQCEEVPSRVISLFKQIVTSIECANNLIVIKTLSGNAGAAGMAIDEMKLPQVLGTIAGDDTALIIAKNNSDADVVVKSLRTL
jgi:transcriptional regulator of arginine metabolism